MPVRQGMPVHTRHTLCLRHCIQWYIKALFVSLIICTFQLLFQPEQYFSLTTNQPKQCFYLFFQRNERTGVETSNVLELVTQLQDTLKLPMCWSWTSPSRRRNNSGGKLCARVDKSPSRQALNSESQT